jgi:hypothetical protein
VVRLFCVALGLFVRGGIHLDFPDENAPRRELELAGFTSAKVYRPFELARAIGDVEPAGARQVRIIEARRLRQRSGADAS